MVIPLNLSPHLHFRHCLGTAGGSCIPPIPSFLSPSRSISRCLMRRRTSTRSVSSPCLPPSSGSESDDVVPISWMSNGKSDDGFGGWCIVDQIQQIPVRPGFPRFLLAGIGSTIAILIVSFAHFSSTRKGTNLQFGIPFRPVVDIFKISEPAKYLKNETDHNALEVADTKLEDILVSTQNEFDQFNNSLHPGKKRYNVVPVAADPTQQEALSLLQRLKITESDVKPYELCTRREYARWLVKANFLLERDPRCRIAPSMLIAGSTIAAFDDVNTDDPDFLFIQAIGESGIVPSKLFSTHDQTMNDGNNNNPPSVDECLFSPESLISRLDLISWKSKLEYSLLPEVDERMLRKSIGLMDLGTISLDMLQELFMDTLAGDRSILRRVFGNIRRLQPLKPVTKAQAAVALTSGRTSDSLQTEISRIESEILSHSIESQEIKSDLLHKGDIPRFWEQKMNQEKEHGLGLQQEFLMISRKFDEEKIAYEKEKDDHIKEKAALDCQWQLLTSLKDEVDSMSARVENEKCVVAAEARNVGELCVDLREVQNAVFEAKSILEAEKEALKILRSWVEDGARQSQFRAKVLEDALQRWKWDR